MWNTILEVCMYMFYIHVMFPSVPYCSLTKYEITRTKAMAYYLEANYLKTSWLYTIIIFFNSYSFSESDIQTGVTEMAYVCIMMFKASAV